MSQKIIDQYTNLPISDQLKWRRRNIEKHRVYEHNRYEQIKLDPEKLARLRNIQNASNRKRRVGARKRLIESLGSKCIKCGFSDWRALQIDHIFGDGHIERKQRRSFDSHRQAAKIRRGFADGKYQLLCANCNWIKRHECKEDGSKQWQLMRGESINVTY